MKSALEEEKKPREDGRTPAFYAVQKDNDGRCMELIECLNEGVDPNAVDLQGDTALHWACWNFRHHAMSVLLERGASPNFQNHKGHTPLHHVINRNRHQHMLYMANELLCSGANASLADNKGKTVYHALMERAKTLDPAEASRFVQLLSDRGGTNGWFEPDANGMTPMDIARQFNDENLVHLIAITQASILDKSTPSLDAQKKASRRL